jgi:uncharacterized protein YacL
MWTQKAAASTQEGELAMVVEASVPVIAAWVDAVVLATAGFINLWNVRSLHALYAELDIPEFLTTTVGLIQILAAAFLTSLDMRVFGIGLAAPILFVSVVMLLDHRYYAIALPIALMMAALLIATLAAPLPHARYSFEFNVPSLPVLA